MGGNIIKTAKVITKTAEKITMTARNGDINLNAAKSVKYSAKKDIVFGEYEPQKPKPQKSLEFSIKIKLTGEKTLVPLGIPSFKGKEENQLINFEVEILKTGVESIKLEILHNDKAIRSHTFNEPYSVGKHIFGWDGFDDSGIYDSTIFTTGKLRVKVTGTLDGKVNTRKTDEFSFEYKEVNWVDTKIDKNSKRIDVTLRVNLVDGGETGTEKDCKEMGASRNSPIVKVCPWDKITKEALSFYKKEPLKSRTKTFEELKDLVLDGINTYWSRRYTNTEGTMINRKNWEIIVTAINTENSEISLDDIPLIYNTNNSWSRSGNTGGSYNDGNLDDEVMGLLPNGIVQRISFNSGYIYHSNWKEWYKSHPIHKTEGWVFNLESKEKEDFKETSAHEIGHELLQAYYGTIYSWQHKGSSYYFPQDRKPINESLSNKITHLDFMESNGENAPKSGEIDLMKYYNDYSDYKDRIVASKKDVKGLLWLTKLSLK
jgi:hypothetical protein